MIAFWRTCRGQFAKSEETTMRVLRELRALSLLLLVPGFVPAGDEPLSRVELGKIGKAATALVEVQARRSYGSAFCVHSSGVFLTNAHVVQGGEVTLILDPGLT